LNRSISNIISLAGWGLLLGLVLMAALSLGWELMAWQNFGYRWLHDLIGIGSTIDHYGPLNLSHPNFHLTSVDERVRLFAGIVRAIHHQGAGLQALEYFGTDGQRIGLLLTEAELIHLQDVARLVNWVRPVGWVAAGLALISSIWIAVLGKQLSGRKLLVVASIWGGLIVLGFLLFGAKAVFYWLHTVVFPAGHQWFFYYEESLMSMMMQAPDLFGAIAMVWGLLTLVIMIIWYRLLHRSQASYYL